MPKLLRHPLSTAFGQMTDEEFAGLEASCLDIGIQEPICLLDGQVLDGWHRYRVHDRHPDLPIRTFNLSEDIDPRDYVLAKNNDRRHLTGSQRAMAVAEVHQWKPPYRPKKAPSTSADNKPAAAAGLFVDSKEGSKTTRELADIAGVGMRTMEHAKAVVKNAAPEVKEAVREGTVSVERAATIAKSVPKNEQVVAMIDAKSAPAVSMLEAEKPAKSKKGADHDEAVLRGTIAQLEAEVKDLREKNAEAQTLLLSMQDDLNSMTAICDAEPGAERIKASAIEAKKFREFARTLEERIRSLQTEKNAAITQARKWEKQAQRNGAATRH